MGSHDYDAALHARMVDSLIERGAIRSAAVETAFRAVPRRLFVPGVPLDRVYRADEAIPTHLRPDGISVSSSSAPSIMAVMVERLAGEPGNAVLEIGTGTGYNAAILAEMVRPGGAVTSVELDPIVAAEAEEHLAAAGVADVRVRTGDGWLGAPHAAPFDRIIVTVGVWDVAAAWVTQLREGGRLVVPLWMGPGFELAVTFERRRSRLISLAVDWCGFMRLRGDHAGPETWVRLGDWTASLANSEAGHVERLSDLLAMTGTREPAPVLPTWWFARLALEEPMAVQLVAHTDWQRRIWGVSDPDDPSLAVIDGEFLVSRGGAAAAARLRRFLDRCQPLDLARLSIEAIPSAEPAPFGTAVLARRDHSFVVRDRG